MANTQRVVLLAPTAGHSVHVRSTDTAGFNLDIDIVVIGNLELELFCTVRCEAARSVWDTKSLTARRWKSGGLPGPSTWKPSVSVGIDDMMIAVVVV